jgi:mono/diheme cytochrome c family protein
MRNPGSSNTFESMTVTITIGAFAALAAIMVAAVALTIAPPRAEATPQLAAQTKFPCGQCHVSPGGGGKLKPFGQKYKR